MVKRTTSILSVLVLMLGLAVLASPPAEAQCFSQERCASLRSEAREIKQEMRTAKHQLRQVLQAIKNADDSVDVEALKEEARGHRQAIRELRSELRPIRGALKEHCRGCH